MCVCVCVCEREREREGGQGRCPGVGGGGVGGRVTIQSCGGHLAVNMSRVSSRDSPDRITGIAPCGFGWSRVGRGGRGEGRGQLG